MQVIISSFGVLNFSFTANRRSNPVLLKFIAMGADYLERLTDSGIEE
jgi:hypothetical protein